jgi:hypothetical protein
MRHPAPAALALGIFLVLTARSAAALDIYGCSADVPRRRSVSSRRT